MLDIDMLRPDKGGDPERFREIQRRRFKDVTLIDRILEADAAWRQQVNAVDSLNAEYNKASKEIGEKMKAKDVAGAEPLKAAQLERGKTIEDAKKQLQELDETRDRLLKSVGNFVHDSVPVHDNEDFNKVERTFWGGRPEQEHKQYRFADLKRVFFGLNSIEIHVTIFAATSTLLQWRTLPTSSEVLPLPAAAATS